MRLAKIHNPFSPQKTITLDKNYCRHGLNAKKSKIAIWKFQIDECAISNTELENY
jgi:hypothetical protein